LERLDKCCLEGRGHGRARQPARWIKGKPFFRSWLAAAAMLFAGSVQADVLDISPSGSVTVYDQPSIFRSEGVHPIVAAKPVQRLQTVSPSATAIGALLTRASDHYALRADLLTSVAWRESHFQSGAVSPRGAVGVMQLMDGTARDLGIDRFDLSQNIFGGAAYLKEMLNRFGGDEALALAAYNAGPGAVLRAGGVPQIRETRDYVSAILGSSPIPSMILVDR
jgi:soluble lytic murein transglycosylase-like protein